ncbi:MAG: MFS transporter [Gemmatimonas sp.]
MTEVPSPKVPLSTQLALYGTSMFSDAASQVVIPLWVLSLHASAIEFGAVIGARSLLPFLLSIHGGVLMDRLGARTVMLFFAAVGVFLPILFPVLPWIWAALMLQLLVGLATTMSWVGAQTVAGQTMKGNRALVGRLSFSNRFGGFFCPFVAGIAWDAFGPWGGFGIMFAFSAVLLVCAMMLPRDLVRSSSQTFRLRDVVPRIDDYISALSLLAIPAVAVVAVGSILNIATGAIQASFFIAYLEHIGLSGSLIGFLVAATNVTALLGTVGVTWLMRRIGGVRLLNTAVIGSILAVMITPFLATFHTLFAVSILRGWSQGMVQPLMISIPAKAVPIGAQGMSVGLRISLNRLVQAVLPLAMGGVVDLIGLEDSFLVVGGGLLLIVAAVMVALSRRGMMPRGPD